MKRLIGLLALVASAILFTAGVATAASPHFKNGGSPTCTITSTSANSTSTTCTATLAGLGNDDLVVKTTTGGFAVYTCQNRGSNPAPGQNKVPFTSGTSTTSIPAGQIKNGNLTFTTNPSTLSAAPTVSGATAGCPNDNWTGVSPALTLTSITLIIEQPPGTQLFSCSASNPNGLSGNVALTC